MANKFAHLTATERAAAPTTPATGDWRVYFKSGGLYVVDDAGVETGPLGVGGGGSTTELLGVKAYNPAAEMAAATTSTTLVDVDATNLAATFTVPASGSVLVRLNARAYNTTTGWLLWGLRDAGVNVNGTGQLITYNQDQGRRTGTLLVTGLTPGATKTYTWAHRVSGGTGTTFAGGTDNGPAVMEIWSAP